MVPGILDIDGAGLSAEDELARQVIRRILPALRGLAAITVSSNHGCSAMMRM